MIKKCLTILILFIVIKVPEYGQEDKLLKNEIGLSMFTIEMNGETINHGLEPKFVIGPYFNMYFSNLSWISSLDFGRNNINDDCVTCEDDFYGIGKLTELNISSGLRYTFQREKSYPVKAFLESDLYYSYSSYEGNFSGGYSGDGTLRDNVYNSVGILGRGGLSVYPYKSLSFTISASLKFGFVKANYKLLNSTETNIGWTTITPFQIRLGYMF